jgi:hypothetical protein
MGMFDSVTKKLSDLNPLDQAARQIEKETPTASTTGPQAAYEAKEKAMNATNPYYNDKEPKDYSSPVQIIGIK